MHIAEDTKNKIDKVNLDVGSKFNCSLDKVFKYNRGFEK